MGTWTTETLAGHPVDLFEPQTRNPHGFVAIYLHGVHLTRLAGNEVFGRELDRHGLPVVAPMTQRSWWTDRIVKEFDRELTAEKHVLRNVVPWIAERYGAKPPRIGLFGTSMGGQGALRFAYKYPDTFPVVAAISPAIDFHKRYYEGDPTIPEMYSEPEAARQDTCLLQMHALNWPRHQWFCCDPTDERHHDSADRLRMKLSALGIPHERDLETSAGGHSFEYYNHMAPTALKFVAERLEKERLRVV
jgi:S-formylglutathione hydrolase FrmB